MRFHVLFFLSSIMAIHCGGAIASDDGGTDASSGSDAPNSKSCNCSSSQFCKLDVTCGSTSGTCVSRPLGCPDLFAPVCGIDGKVYDNTCAANAAGVDVDAKGGCQAPQGFVPCGGSFCNAAVAYCQSSPNDVAGPGQACSFDDCPALPPACTGSKDCACFGPSVPCATMCTFDGNGFEIECPGG